MGNQNPYIEEEQILEWGKGKVQKNKQGSTNHTYKTKDRVTRTPLKTRDELMCSGGVNSSCSTSDTHNHLLHRTVYSQKTSVSIILPNCSDTLIFAYISEELIVIFQV